MNETYIEMHDAMIHIKLRAETNELDMKTLQKKLDKILKKPTDGETTSKQLPKQKKV